MQKKTQQKLKALAKLIQSAHSFVLTTHKMGDGDGLGSMLALSHALKSQKKKVRAISVDPVSEKYRFLSKTKWVESYSHLKKPLPSTDIALVLDTNDHRRITPFYDTLQKKCGQLIYIDHHPILKSGQKISPFSVVDTSSASAGQLVYFLLKEMGIRLTPPIARALYVSIVFDTKRFQFTRNSALSHQICATLSPYIKDNESIYNHLFGQRSLQKQKLTAKAIEQTQYYFRKKVAILEVKNSLLKKNNMGMEDACDFVDMNLEIPSTQISVLIVHLPKNTYKVSFRSKKENVCKLAELFNGGGHKRASGVFLSHYTKNPKKEILKFIKTLFAY